MDEGNPRAEPLTCRELVELVTYYLEGGLTPLEQRRFEDHLAGCGPCTIYLAQMRRRLMEAIRYPQPARSRGLIGTVTLDILIGPNGAIGNVSVTRSSSHPLLDEAALEAARSLAPQPFPKGLAPRPLRAGGPRPGARDGR